MNPHQTEVDWLLQTRSNNFCKDACMLSLEAAIRIAKECCHPSLNLEEMKELVEMVWFGMEDFAELE